MHSISLHDNGSRREKDKALKREVILDAADKLFTTRGYFLTTTDDIARESGYSVGTLYNLFRDKEGIYAEVIARIGIAVLRRTKQAASQGMDPEQAMGEAVKLRLYNFTKDRLFFQAFSAEGHAGVLPDPSSLPHHVEALYREYVHLIEGLFRRVIERKRLIGVVPLHLTLSLEAAIQVFMAYWERPGQSGSLDDIARHIVHMHLSPVTLQTIGAIPAEKAGEAMERSIHISRFDLERLRELIHVAHDFGNEKTRAFLQELEIRLASAKVVSPHEVPGDLITMHSVVQLQNADTGMEETCRLVFPRDAASKKENISILSPLGTRLLGSRINDIVETNANPLPRRYLVKALLYQPEAAGDFHL